MIAVFFGKKVRIIESGVPLGTCSSGDNKMTFSESTAPTPDTDS